MFNCEFGNFCTNRYDNIEEDILDKIEVVKTSFKG